MMMMMMNGNEYTESAAMTAAECYSLNSLSKKKKNKNKRRFSEDQIRSLETIFESESKLEPRKKLQLARELGLQPRQIAIWFQNKRARFKSKQLEREYSILRANYNTLASQFEAMKKDKQALQVQLQKLKDAMRKSGEKEKRSDDGGDDVKSEFGVKPSLPVEKSEHRIGVHLLSDGDSSSTKAETYCGVDEEAKPSLSFDRSEHGVGVLSDEDSSMKAEYFGLDEEPPLLDMVEPADSSLTSPENWGSLDSSGLLDDQSGTSYQWWDFWS